MTGAGALGWALGALAGLSLGAVPAPNDLEAKGRSGAVASADPHASAAGIAVLKAGGNAMDAAVAVALVLAVTHPQAGNLGGGGFFVARMADGRNYALDFREKAPAGAQRDMFLRADGSVDEDRAQFGALAAGVPGSPMGLEVALAKLGTRPLAELARPAIRLAREGIEVDHFLAAALKAHEKVLGRYPATRKVFFSGERVLTQGERLVQKDLAATLERFAQAGAKGFYEGETARLLVAEMQRGGGILSAKDLQEYRAIERPVLVGRYRGFEVLTMPPPSSGGIALLQMLALIEPYDVAGMGFGSSQGLHLRTEVMRRAFADRARWLGDPDFYKVPVEGLLAPSYLDRLRLGMRLDRRSEVEPGQPEGAPEGDHTTHFSVVDAAGNAVACTTTLNASFGCGLVADGTGVLLNNEMDDFSAKPGVPNQFGLVGGRANQIEPGKRMLSSMTPTILLSEGKVRYVLGSPGGGRIINTVFQVVTNLVDHGMPLDLAVAAPRIHHQWKPDQITWETLALSVDVRERLQDLGHRFARTAVAIGQVSAIAVLKDGTRFAVQDPRSGGAAMAY
ncbi:MAG: gamma-glutamyltransferase [Planctomycetes bacterium]|nr:gamma-glutamyltransferase [Planctomycetota bacterium]